LSSEYYWTLPTRHDGRGRSVRQGIRAERTAGEPTSEPTVRDVRAGHYDYLDHVAQVARAAAVAGFTGALVPFDPQGEDSWVVSTALAREFPTLVFVTEFSPSFGTPVYATKMAATFQRFSAGRLGWKLAIDGDPVTSRALGDYVEGDARYERATEFLDVSSGIWGHTGFNFKGRFYEVEEGGLHDPLTRHPRPLITLSGVSPEALSLSASHGDVHVWDWSSPSEFECRKAELDHLAAAQGRRIRHAVQLALVARETSQEAWDEVQRRWIHTGEKDQNGIKEFALAPEIWSGFERIGEAVPTGIVGSYEQVAKELHQLVEAGAEVFHLGASPGLEEAYRFGEQIAPILEVQRRELERV
jgi:alkanesulfonate monooxygenase